MTIEQIKDLLADIAQGNKKLQASQDRTDAQLIELRTAQQKTEDVQQDTKIALQELAAAQQKTEAVQQDTKIALQELAAAQQKTEDVQQDTKIALQELAAAQQKTEAVQQDTKIALQELSVEMQKLAVAQQKTEAAQKELSAEMQKLAAAQQKTEAAQQETAATLQKVIQEYGGFINNQGQQAEDFFIKGLCKQDLQVAGIKFDEIFPRQARQYGRSGIEVDALLTNGEYVALLEVKSKVHINDVEAVFNKRIPAFRNFFHDYRDKSLLVLIGGNIFNSDALRKAHDYGFICLTPDNQDLHIEAADFREY